MALIVREMLKARLKQDGMLWVSWPKASSGVETDLGDGALREAGLSNGLVDVKVCAVDESGRARLRSSSIWARPRFSN